MQALVGLFLSLFFIGLLIWAVGFWWFLGGVILLGLIGYADGK